MLYASLTTPVRELPSSQPQPRLRLAAYARLSGLGHPYFRLLHQALERHGVAIAGPVEIGVSWLRANRDALDVVHFHWPETIWRGRRSEPRRFVAGVVHATRELLRFARFLHEAHRLGIARVWTIHNLEPHEVARSGIGSDTPCWANPPTSWWLTAPGRWNKQSAGTESRDGA